MYNASPEKIQRPEVYTCLNAPEVTTIAWNKKTFAQVIQKGD